MTPYILDDNPELGPNEARLKSIEIMRGHKGKLFGLDLSFIGWFLLGILSLGIGFIWIEPYFYTARASFYRNLKEELELICSYIRYLRAGNGVILILYKDLSSPKDKDIVVL